jgi:hypothetical protein
VSERDVYRELPDLPVPVLWRLGLRETQLPPMAKLTAFVIDTYLGRNSKWKVAVPTIAKGAGIAERTVQTALKELDGTFFDIESGGGRKNPHLFIRRLTPETVQVVRAFFMRAAERVQLTTEMVQLSAVNPAGAAPVVDLEVGLSVENLAANAARENLSNSDWPPPCDVCGVVDMSSGPLGEAWLCTKHINQWRRAAAS